MAHIIWNKNGYLVSHHIEDFAGGIVVNILSSATIVAGSAFLAYKGVPDLAVKIPQHSGRALSSALLVWLLWIGLAAGKAHDAGPVAAQAVVNTIAAVQASILFGYLFDRSFAGQELADSPVSMLSHILLGLVAITPGCGYTTVGGAMFISVTTVGAVKVVARYVLQDGVAVHDPLNCLTAHGIGGTMGFLMTAVSSYSFINPDALNGLTYGDQTPARMHVAVALALWGSICAAVLVLMFLCDLVVPISVQTDSSERLFVPIISHATPVVAVQQSRIGGGVGGGEWAEEEKNNNSTSRSAEDDFVLAREVSLYKKLSKYFTQSNLGVTTVK